MKVIKTPALSGNYLATIAIGKRYADDFYENSYGTWVDYCNRYDLGLIVFEDDLIERNHKCWKKPTWQKMLIGDALNEKGITAKNICYLDTDIIISPFAENIFKEYNEERIGIISKRSRLPYPLVEVQKRLAMLRKKNYDENYPLDSSLFISLKDLYEFHNLKPQANEACMGVIVFNQNNHSKIMKDWFMKYDKNVESITNGGDQTHYNYEIQSKGIEQWIDYRYQTIWSYEAAWYYPFLLKSEIDIQLFKECLRASLYRNYFIHFAGNWPESLDWKKVGKLEELIPLNERKEYIKYLEYQCSGKPKGVIRPRY